MKLSVIIATYNNEDTIERCINSIPRYKDLEIIVVNDGSTDNTLEELNKFNDIKVITYKNNKGVSHARNRGFTIAKGEYILILDGDDYIYQDAFKEIYDNYLKIVDMVFFDMIDNEDRKYLVNKFRIFNRVGNFKFVKKDFMEKYDEDITYAEDRELHSRLLAKNPTFKCTELLMYHYNFPRVGSLTYLHDNKGELKP